MKYILFHAKKVIPFRPCIDGLFAAYAAKQALPDAVLVPAMYGHPPDLMLTEGDTLYLLDLTYPGPILLQWSKFAKVIVIDHHKGAMRDLAGLSDAITTEFDMARSGAVMAWQHFIDAPIPELFRYVQDRDLWLKKLPDCDLVSLGLSELMHKKSLSECFDMIDSHFFDVNHIKEIGSSVKHEIDEAIANACRSYHERLVLGYRVAFFMCQTERELQAYSDIGNALAQLRPDLAFTVVQTGDGWALRSTGFDVSLVAKQLGGNGHQCASGTRAELPRNIANLTKLVK